jgi:hypothetical protein
VLTRKTIARLLAEAQSARATPSEAAILRQAEAAWRAAGDIPDAARLIEAERRRNDAKPRYERLRRDDPRAAAAVGRMPIPDALALLPHLRAPAHRQKGSTGETEQQLRAIAELLESGLVGEPRGAAKLVSLDHRTAARRKDREDYLIKLWKRRGGGKK